MKLCVECFHEWDGDILTCPECGSLKVQDDFSEDDEEEDDDLEKQRMVNHYWKSKGVGK